MVKLKVTGTKRLKRIVKELEKNHSSEICPRLLGNDSVCPRHYYSYTEIICILRSIIEVNYVQQEQEQELEKIVRSIKDKNMMFVVNYK